jgi:hypothetical protein
MNERLSATRRCAQVDRFHAPHWRRERVAARCADPRRAGALQAPVLAGIWAHNIFFGARIIINQI